MAVGGAGVLTGAANPMQGNLVGFYQLLLDSLSAERDGASGYALSCSSAETAASPETYQITAVVKERYSSFGVELALALVSTASADAVHSAELRAMHESFQEKLNGVQRQLELKKLQMTQRFFFGVNWSIHIECKALVTMENPASDEGRVRMGWSESSQE